MKHILVVDDDKNIVMVTKLILQQLGFGVFTARNGLEGIEILETQNHLDLVLTDIRMPEMDGNEFARYVRNSTKYMHIPMVAITGYGDEADSQLFKFVLLKPFRVQDLAKVIDSFS